MSIKNNGTKRDAKRLLGSAFLLLIGISCMFMTFRNGFRFSWLLISLAVLYLSFAMFRSSNEV